MADSNFNIDIPNLSLLIDAFSKAPELSEKILQDTIKESAVALGRFTNQSTVPYKSGKLLNTFLASFGRLTSYWGPTVVYKEAIEFGMPPSPGRYVPAIGKRLVNNRGRDIGVWPGFPANPYMERIRDAAQPTITQMFEDALQNINEQIALESNG